MPAEIPVSNCVDVPDGQAWDFVREPLAAIDHVHHDGALPTIPVISTQSRDPGRYEFRLTGGQPLRIRIREIGSHPRLAFVHEIGHFLDHQALGTMGRFASANGRLPDLMQAINRSQSVVRLRARANQRYAFVRDMRGRRIRESVEPNIVRYMLLPEECFARAYAQYIAIRSGEPRLLEELGAIRANAYDDLFQQRGWTR
jgi:hypothetical protein